MTETITKYTNMATSKTPALHLFILDVSRSMEDSISSGGSKLEAMIDAFYATMVVMVKRSVVGSGQIRDRYKVGMIAYSDDPVDVLGGFKNLSEIAKLGKPKLKLIRGTNTSAAFQMAESMLKVALQNYAPDRPAPVVCHITDGIYTTEDPEPAARRIRALSALDGNVLLENVFIADNLLPSPITNPSTWEGVHPGIHFTGEMAVYAEKLRSMSSPLPESYWQNIANKEGYAIRKEAVMMLPGNSLDLLKLACSMAMATRVSNDAR